MKRFSVGSIVSAAIVLLLASAGVAFANLTFNGTSIMGNTSTTIDATGTISIGPTLATGIMIGNTNSTVLFPGNMSVGTTTIPGGAPTGSISIAGKYYGDGSDLTGVVAGMNPTSCTANSTTTICITLPPYNASTNGGTTTVTSGTFAAGTSGSVASCSTFLPNQGVLITGAGTSGANYIGTVVSCSGTTLTVTPATVTSVANGIVVQHDETAAFQSAITALTSTGGTIYVPDGTYLVNGPLQDTSGANAVLTLPNIGLNSAPSFPISIVGFTSITPFSFAGGAHIITSQNTGNFIGAYASGSSLIPNMVSAALYLKNLYFHTTSANPGVTMINGTDMSILQADQVWVDSAYNGNTPSNTSGAGIIMPKGGNSVYLTLDHVVVGGFYKGVVAGEHTQIGSLWMANDFDGLVLDSQSSQGNSVSVDYVWCQLCTNMIAAGSSPTEVNVQVADSEVTTQNLVYDPSNLLEGIINYSVPYSDSRSNSTRQIPHVTGGANLQLVNLQYPSIVLSRPTFNPSNTGALYYVGVAATGTPGDCLEFAANGIDVVDSGAPCGGSSSTSTAATPTVSPIAGTYLGVQQVTPSCSTASSTMYYTLDGSTPTTVSTPYVSGTIATAATGSTLKIICTASGYLNSAVRTAVYTTNLVAGWKTTDGSGTTITDQVAGNNLTLSNGAWSGAITPLTNSVVYNGTSTSAVTASGTFANFERTQPFSAVTWADNTSTSTAGFTEQALFGKLDGNNNYRGWRMELIYISGTGWKVHVNLISTNPGNQISQYCNTPVSTNTMHDIGFSYDGSSTGPGVHIYIDGSECSSYTNDINALSATIQNSIPEYYGSYENFSSGYFTGNLGNAYIYSRALTSTEFSTLYSTPYEPGL